MTPKWFLMILTALPLPALAQVSVAEAGIQSSDEVYDPYLREMRKQMVAGQRIPFDALRALADLGDGLAAFKMGEYLVATGKPALQDDALHYFAIAAYTGRDFAVSHLLRALAKDQSETSDARLKGAEDALRLWARRGDATARLGLAHLYLAGSPFGAQAKDGLALLEQVAAGGNAEAAMELAMLYLKGRTDLPADPEKARAALTMAMDSDDLAARAMAENLLRALPATPDTAPANATANTTVNTSLSTAGATE